jgi:hypothetical protein
MGNGLCGSAKCASYLPEGPTDPVMEARVLILKDEAGRKDKCFLYDSHGDLLSLHNGRFSPLPKRVGTACCELMLDGSRFGGHHRIHVWCNSFVLQRHDNENAPDSSVESLSTRQSASIYSLVHRSRS